jgi:glycosyltransferase involved in cell wall biosynthesis
VRVLHIGAGNLYGGIETMLVSMARYRHECSELECHFTVCFEGRLSEELRSTGVPVYHLGDTRFSRPWTVWLTRWRLNRLLKKERFDTVVVHSCWTHSIYAKVVRRHQIPLVFWLHEPPKGIHWLERRAMKYSPSYAIANSRFTQSSIGNLFPDVKSTVIYPMVAPPKRSIRTREEIRNLCDTSIDRVVILIVARFEEWKGHRVLFEGLNQIRDDSRWVCWIAGGAQRESEEKYVRELKAIELQFHLDGRIRWLGQRSDIPDLMAAADVYCQPNSSGEPFGIAFIEAMYAGLPVITSAIGGAVEIVHRESGELVPPNDPTRLGQTLRSWVDSVIQKQYSTKSSQDRAKELCDPKQQLQKLRQSLELVSSKH